MLTERIKLNLLFNLSNLNSNFALTLGYLKPALNNSALFANAASRFANEPGQTNCCLTVGETTVNCLVSDPYKVLHLTVEETTVNCLVSDPYKVQHRKC